MTTVFLVLTAFFFGALFLSGYTLLINVVAIVPVIFVGSLFAAVAHVHGHASSPLLWGTTYVVIALQVGYLVGTYMRSRQE